VTRTRTDTTPESASVGFTQTLWTHYRSGQARFSSRALYEDIRSAWPYYRANYLQHFNEIPREASVLEIGCGSGSLLAWLQSLGFKNLRGVDLSPGDVEFANRHLNSEIVRLSDAQPYLEENRGRFRVIIAKATLEHIPKDRLLSVVESVADALNVDGMAIVDVPNMDWVLGLHERYMDLTHELGFTRQSLASLLDIVFEAVDIRGSVLANPTRTQRWFRRPLLAVLRRLLYIVGEGASDVLFESRSIIAVAGKPRRRQAAI
jgi:2-polyprenyl-3-methyl-5-hydroxy-6-metoxy-1,4-benzoquinol methylase